ncbi:MAG: DUF4388 domain-containing protein [Deltaproteobacteria bacterium]|nr:DUF4388 domain-containing protein [Deltaproteobacteria bacterium]
MPRLQERVVIACDVELLLEGGPVRVVTQDLAPSGIFVRTDHLLPENSEVSVRLWLPTGLEIASNARVVHRLTREAAVSLARLAGMGLELLDEAACHALREYLEELHKLLEPAPDRVRNERVVVIEASGRLRQRMATGLRKAGFTVESAADGLLGFELCRARRPMIVVAGADSPGLDGWALLELLGRDSGLASTSVVILTDEFSDLTRLRAYRLGAAELIPRPFTMAELLIRLRRLARVHQLSREQVVLRGRLSEIALGTLLSLLELERKTGMLTITRDTEVAWISVIDGAIAKIEGVEEPVEPTQKMMRVIDWAAGEFEFSAGPVPASGAERLPVTALLLEHARLRDEASR